MVETIPSWSSLKFQPSTLHVPATFFFSAHLWCFQLSVRFQKECTRLPYVFFNVFIRSIFLLCVCELCCVFCLPNGVVVVAGNISPFSWIKWFSSSLKVIVLFFSSKRWFVLSKKIKHAPDSDPFLYIVFEKCFQVCRIISCILFYLHIDVWAVHSQEPF